MSNGLLYNSKHSSHPSIEQQDMRTGCTIRRMQLYDLLRVLLLYAHVLLRTDYGCAGISTYGCVPAPESVRPQLVCEAGVSDRSTRSSAAHSSPCPLPAAAPLYSYLASVCPHGIYTLFRLFPAHRTTCASHVYSQHAQGGIRQESSHPFCSEIGHACALEVFRNGHTTSEQKG